MSHRQIERAASVGGERARPERAREHARELLDPVGLRTLFVKEVRRFTKVWLQTVLTPLLTTSLYFLVFGMALGSRLREVHGLPYMQFVVPGLMMLSMIHNSFLNTASSLFQSRINGTIVDLLVAPLGTLEILLAYVGAAMLRALLVGSLVYLVSCLFLGFELPVHLGWTLYFALTVTATFALVGLLTALWAEKYDHLALVPNFFLVPMTFLGGVFYSVDMLPEPWRSVSRLNPVLYTVDGLRYGVLGVADGDVTRSALAVAVLLLALTAWTALLLSRGYKLRA